VQVRILTFCGNREALYGAVMVFKTIRTGFPTAEILVLDNAGKCASEIHKAATDAGCEYHRLETQIEHGDFIERAIRNASGPLAIVDSDVVFWKNVEDWTFGDALIAGRYIPKYFEMILGGISMARVHPSFYFIPDAERLAGAMDGINIKTSGGFYFHPFHPTAVVVDGERHVYDTGACAYSLLRDGFAHFTPEHLDAYDHLACGANFDWARGYMDGGVLKAMDRVHKAAREGDLEKIRGFWRLQERFFARA
jgi:hypothetical protein